VPGWSGLRRAVEASPRLRSASTSCSSPTESAPCSRRHPRRAWSRGSGRSFSIDRRSPSAARARDNDIVLDHPSVSPHHAVVERTGDTYRLLDQQSATGVRVNGEDYYGVDLLAGDEVEIGAVKLRFVSGGPAR